MCEVSVRDKWCGEEWVAFPNLFATSKEAWLEEVWDGSLEEGCWALKFVRASNN